MDIECSQIRRLDAAGALAVLLLRYTYAIRCRESTHGAKRARPTAGASPGQQAQMCHGGRDTRPPTISGGCARRAKKTGRTKGEWSVDG